MAQEKRNDNKLECSKYVYEQVNGWIGNADNKVSISCGIFSGVFGVITFLSERISTQNTTKNCWSTVYHLCFWTSLVLMLISIFLYVLAINPNLTKSGKKANGTIPKKKYPIFYGDIADMTLDDYKHAINQAAEVDMINELQAETNHNSRICMKKMERYKAGLWISFAAIVFALGSLGAHFLMVQ